MIASRLARSPAGRAALLTRNRWKAFVLSCLVGTLAVLAAVGLPGDMFTPTFAVSRSVGWTAHVLEQVSNNRLIRPQSEFVGRTDRTLVPIEQR